MTQELAQYLESIMSNARLDNNDGPVVMSELEAHIEDKLRELKDAGLTEEEAVKTCMWEMGSIKSIARQIYEAYSQGSWKQVLLASMPHLLFGLLFVLNWWAYPQWLSLVIILTIATACYGWGHGKPAWVFPWLGYSLIPVITVGLLLLYLPVRWSFLGIVVYFPLALWWVFRIIIQATRKDWLLSSLMLLPLPVIISWFLAISPSGKLSEAILERVNAYAPWIGLSFMMMALTIATFIRVRQRWLRVGLLAVSGSLTLTVAVYIAAGQLNNAAFFGPVLAMWAVILIPPLLERHLKKAGYYLKKYQDKRGKDYLPTS